MARKKSGDENLPATAEPVTKHSRIELSLVDHMRLMAAAKRIHLPVAAYIRMVVMERVEADEQRRAKS